MTDNKNLSDAYETVLACEKDKLKRLEEELRMQQAFVEVLTQRAGANRINRRSPAMAGSED